MFTVCVGLVFRSKYVQFPIICSLQYSININTVEVDPHSDLLHSCIVKPKNVSFSAMLWTISTFKISMTPKFIKAYFSSYMNSSLYRVQRPLTIG